MSKSSNYIFKGMTLLAGLIFVGLCIEAGGILTNLFFHFYNPKVLPRLFNTLDLTEMYDQSTWAFWSMYSFILVTSALKVVLFLEVVQLTTKLDLSNPFNSYVSKKISRISYDTLSIGLISYIAVKSRNYFEKKEISMDVLSTYWEDSQTFIVMAGIIYIIAVIFRKGLEIQQENELTV